MKARVLMAIVMTLALLPVALAAPPAALAAPPDVSGTTWVGWTDHGSSTATGVYARGGTLQNYQIYSVVFVYDSANPVPGTSSGFVNGHKILGVGIRNNSGASGSPTIKLDPNNNSYYPETVPGNGQSSFSGNADLGDPIVNTSGGNPTEITIRNSGAWVSSGPPCVTAGGTCYYLPNGGAWGGPGQPGFRGINPGTGVWKVFFDLDQMTTEFKYPGGTRNSTGPGLGAFGSAITFATGGLGGTEAVVRNVSTVSAALTATTTDALICTGETTTVNFDLADVVGLYGYQFQVSYDATKASASGAFVNSFFDTNTNGSVPPGWGAVCSGGVCKFAKSEVAPDPAVSGSGTLAQITLTGAVPGTFNMAITSDVLSDINGAALPHNVGAPLPITVCGLATVDGYVTLQGRPVSNVDTGTVSLIEQGTNFTPPGVTPVTFSNGNGSYSFVGVPFMPGGSSYQIVAEHGLYLDNQEIFTVSGNVTNKNTRLWGGDANNDGDVTIADLSCIGGDFGGPPNTCSGTSSSDINADGTVNIQDLSLAGGNYDKCGAQPWAWNTATPVYCPP